MDVCTYVHPPATSHVLWMYVYEDADLKFSRYLFLSLRSFLGFHLFFSSFFHTLKVVASRSKLGDLHPALNWQQTKFTTTAAATSSPHLIYLIARRRFLPFFLAPVEGLAFKREAYYFHFGFSPPPPYSTNVGIFVLCMNILLPGSQFQTRLGRFDL